MNLTIHTQLGPFLHLINLKDINLFYEPQEINNSDTDTIK